LTLRLSAGTPNLPAAIAVNGKKTISEGIDYRGEKVLAATRAIPDSPWFIVSKVDKEEVYAPIRQRLWNVMLLIGLCIISAGAGVILIWRRREAEEERRYRQYLEETVKERTGELERSNRRLEASYRDLESFSYAASHDLREPLIVIEWSSGNLLKKYGDKLDDEGREKLTTISEKTRQLTHFIGDLLSFSRVSTREIEKSDIDMEALAKNVAEEIKATLGDRNLELEIKSLPVAWGDPSMMRQVVINLLSNAFKYTRREETARIEIGGTEERAETIYYVKDNGIGFDEDASEKLFSLFKRLHASEEFEGTGIGLFIIKRVIEKHGGRVWAEGRINEGAIFYFSLPVGPRG
ncbi:MAG TPA: ATP-binding protein, partial [Thermodesulfovibrionales bacterium]|nr:ATP-binding protein [Thermodesulfovibrionales bacterium]